jgi:hypothetical protein
MRSTMVAEGGGGQRNGYMVLASLGPLYQTKLQAKAGPLS